VRSSSRKDTVSRNTSAGVDAWLAGWQQCRCQQAGGEQQVEQIAAQVGRHVPAAPTAVQQRDADDGGRRRVGPGGQPRRLDAEQFDIERRDGDGQRHGDEQIPAPLDAAGGGHRAHRAPQAPARPAAVPRALNRGLPGMPRVHAPRLA
jgi:hypothetical protein